MTLSLCLLFCIFRCSVKNKNVNAKQTRTTFIILFVWPGPREPCEHIVIRVWNNMSVSKWWPKCTFSWCIYSFQEVYSNVVFVVVVFESIIGPGKALGNKWDESPLSLCAAAEGSGQLARCPSLSCQLSSSAKSLHLGMPPVTDNMNPSLIYPGKKHNVYKEYVKIPVSFLALFFSYLIDLHNFSLFQMIYFSFGLIPALTFIV